MSGSLKVRNQKSPQGKNMGWWIFVEDATEHGRFCHECGDFHIWEDFYKLASERMADIQSVKSVTNVRCRGLSGSDGIIFPQLRVKNVEWRES